MIFQHVFNMSKVVDFIDSSENLFWVGETSRMFRSKCWYQADRMDCGMILNLQGKHSFCLRNITNIRVDFTRTFKVDV